MLDFLPDPRTSSTYRGIHRAIASPLAVAGRWLRRPSGSAALTPNSSSSVVGRRPEVVDARPAGRRASLSSTCVHVRRAKAGAGRAFLWFSSSLLAVNRLPWRSSRHIIGPTDSLTAQPSESQAVSRTIGRIYPRGACEEPY